MQHKILCCVLAMAGLYRREVAGVVAAGVVVAVAIGVSVGGSGVGVGNSIEKVVLAMMALLQSGTLPAPS